MIVVDAGHGGHDPGTSHHGLREKVLALDIAQRLERTLTKRGLSVVMTRSRDEFIALSRRPAIANRLPADLFVSVHINANRNRRVSGIEVYYPRVSTSSARGSLPPAVQPTEVFLPTETVRAILWDLALSQSRRQSARMAATICRTMRDRLRVTCRGARGARFVVLREAAMPAVLVEVGYLSNRAEASRLATSTYRQAVAEAIADGLTQHIRDLGQQHI